MNSFDDDFNETETREFITDALKAKGWKLGFNMRYEYKITDGRVQIDECHRGSAKKDSEWRQILDYFSGAVQIGMTATRRDDADSDNSNISYFGKPLYTYSLKQGIEDGFFAPYRVTKVHINVDGGMDISEEDAAQSGGRLEVGQTIEKKDLVLKLGIKKHYYLAAKRITDFLEKIGPMTKTIVFCDDAFSPYSL